MNYTFFPLWSDICLYFMLAGICIFCFKSYGSHIWLRINNHLKNSRLGILSFMTLIVFFTIGFLDSIHFRVDYNSNNKPKYNQTIISTLDIILDPISFPHEKTYSSPFSLHSFVKEMVELQDNKNMFTYPRLNYTAPYLNTESEIFKDIFSHSTYYLFNAAFVWFAIFIIYLIIKSLIKMNNPYSLLKTIASSKSYKMVRFFFIALFVIIAIVFLLYGLSRFYHLCGTDKVGQDIFYQTVKSIRTGLLVGTLTTVIILPFAIIFGIIAGFFGGIIDDFIQYIYTTISSIPGILLIASTILAMQVYISNHEDLFQYIEQRADLRLLSLCFILGLTSWTSLCRILRGETLKIRELEFIQASKGLGVSNIRIMIRHVLPNVQHIILITLVLDFSALVLAEAILSYVGVGVSPTTNSWGNMINTARLELSREPVVWWPITFSFIFMFGLVISANLFADCIRDAIDPKSTKN